MILRLPQSRAARIALFIILLNELRGLAVVAAIVTAWLHSR